MGPVVGALVGDLVGALVVPLVDPLVGRGSLSPVPCIAHLCEAQWHACARTPIALHLGTGLPLTRVSRARRARETGLVPNPRPKAQGVVVPSTTTDFNNFSTNPEPQNS